MAWDGNNVSLTNQSPLNFMRGNTVYMMDDISDETCAYLISDIHNFVTTNTSGDSLDVIINSRGGDVATTFTILGLLTIAKINGITVRTYVMGLAASAASMLAAAGTIRYMTRGARHMIHFGSHVTVAQKQSEMEKIFEQTKALSQQLDDVYLEHCPKLTQKHLDTICSDERGYLTAQECLELTLCDVILEDELAEKTRLLTQFEEFEKQTKAVKSPSKRTSKRSKK